MLKIRRSAQRGHADHGWLDSYHTFSFADYHDPDQMGFSVLRVINEDRVAPGRGFGKHPHRDMEIVSIVLAGELEHADSMGNEGRIKPGEVQIMSAGTGIVHGEANPQPMAPVHFLQIWIEPNARGLVPSYGQAAFDPAARQGALQPVVTPDGRDGSLVVHQDASLYLAHLDPGQRVDHALAPGRRAYVQVLAGTVEADGQRLAAGDGARIEDQASLALAGVEAAEVLLFDLP